MTPSNEACWRAWAEIDPDALRHNLGVAQRRAPGTGVIAVVKADAYGHGFGRVTAAMKASVAGFGVAAMSEAETVAECLAEGNGGGRRTAPFILLMGTLLSEELEVAIARGWEITLSSLSELQTAADIAQAQGTVAQLHLAVDTGMGRLGALESDFFDLCRTARGRANVRVRGLTTHLPSADEDADFTERQLAGFSSLVGDVLKLWGNGEDAPKVHALNSAGVLRFAGRLPSQGLMRPGLMLYGVAPEPCFQDELRPVMALKTRVRLVRDLPAGRGVSYGRTFVTKNSTRVATLGMGYGDGYPRGLSGKGADVLIAGRRCPLLGRVTMDQIMVDVTSLPGDLSPGEEVVVFGRQGESEVSVREVAEKAGTIPWEILTNISRRIPRLTRPLRGKTVQKPFLDLT